MPGNVCRPGVSVGLYSLLYYGACGEDIVIDGYLVMRKHCDSQVLRRMTDNFTWNFSQVIKEMKRDNKSQPSSHDSDNYFLNWKF